MNTSQITDADFIGPLPHWNDILCDVHVYMRNRGDAVKGQPMQAQSAYSNRKCRCDACKLSTRLGASEYRLGNLEAAREHARRYYRDNQEKILEQKRGHYLENREERLEYFREYKRSPAGKAGRNRANLKRRSTDQAFFEAMTEDEHARFFEISEYFHPVLDTHVDHVIPVALGGTSHPDNLAVLTAHENQLKGDKHPGEWNYHTVVLAGKYRIDQN